MKLFRKCLTPLACASSGGHSLSALRKAYGENSVILMLAAWISNLQKFLNVSAKMDGAQIHETCQMILDDFWALNSADVNLVMSRAKRGFYGQLFGRIDGQIIYQWFAEYFEERCEACANREVHVAGLHGSVINRLSDETKAKILELWESQGETKAKMPLFAILRRVESNETTKVVPWYHLNIFKRNLMGYGDKTRYY